MTWSSWTSGSVSTTATTNRNQRTEPRIATFPGPCHATHRIPMSNLYQFMNICHKQSEEVSSNPLQNRFYSSLLSSCFPPLPLVVGWSLSSCFCILKYSQVLDLVRQFPSQKSLLRSKCHRIQNDFSDFSITYMYVYTHIYICYIYIILDYIRYIGIKACSQIWSPCPAPPPFPTFTFHVSPFLIVTTPCSTPPPPPPPPPAPPPPATTRYRSSSAFRPGRRDAMLGKDR